MNFLDYLYKRLDDVNQQRAKQTNNNARLVWLNGQREILLSIIFDLEQNDKQNDKNSNKEIGRLELIFSSSLKYK